jgi:hypothetical protein
MQIISNKKDFINFVYEKLLSDDTTVAEIVNIIYTAI